jgi:putative SOS response-associated peptidase YedK
LAALYKPAQNDDDEAKFVVITRPSTDATSWIHDRMPVCLTSAQASVWLDESKTWNDVNELLDRCDIELSAVPVSTFVSQTGHDGPECRRQVDPSEVQATQASPAKRRRLDDGKNRKITQFFSVSPKK